MGDGGSRSDGCRRRGRSVGEGRWLSRSDGGRRRRRSVGEGQWLNGVPQPSFPGCNVIAAQAGEVYFILVYNRLEILGNNDKIANIVTLLHDQEA